MKKIFLSKIFSRKLFVFLVATVLMIAEFIEPTDWLIVTGVYLGVNALGKFGKGGLNE